MTVLVYDFMFLFYAFFKEMHVLFGFIAGSLLVTGFTQVARNHSSQRIFRYLYFSIINAHLKKNYMKLFCVEMLMK